MARHNICYLYGLITKDPKLITDPKTGGLNRVKVQVTIARGNRSMRGQENDSYQFDTPPLLVRDPMLMVEVSQWKENDIVIVKGNVCTKDQPRKYYCEYCGEQSAYDGTIPYIVPVYCTKIGQVKDKEEGFKYLKKNCELSNNVIVLGYACEPPKIRKKKRKITSVGYNIALNRKFYISADPANISTDYPHITSFGEVALEDAKRIKTGTMLMIEGYLQTMEFKKTVKCSHCGREYVVSRDSMTVVPYSVEYMDGFRDTDEIEKLQKESPQKAFEDIYGLEVEEDFEEETD